MALLFDFIGMQRFRINNHHDIFCPWPSLEVKNRAVLKEQTSIWVRQTTKAFLLLHTHSNTKIRHMLSVYFIGNK